MEFPPDFLNSVYILHKKVMIIVVLLVTMSINKPCAAVVSRCLLEGEKSFKLGNRSIELKCKALVITSDLNACVIGYGVVVT